MNEGKPVKPMPWYVRLNLFVWGFFAVFYVIYGIDMAIIAAAIAGVTCVFVEKSN